MASLSSVLSIFTSRSANETNEIKSSSDSKTNELQSSKESSKTSTEDKSGEEKKKPSPCCCCKETKQARDACIVENGAENCTDLIEAHRVCMKGFGYEI